MLLSINMDEIIFKDRRAVLKSDLILMVSIFLRTHFDI